MIEIRFKLNGESARATVLPALSALKLLRGTFGLAGTKPGCGEGECGACTILLDGKAVNACLVPAALLDGREVRTIEGLAAADGALHPVQQAFVEVGAIQCGFCTPGMIMRTVAFLDERPDPTDDEIARGLEGNLCRCTGYVKIRDAIRSAAAARSGAGTGGES
jgi:carbon-monoxide dehydrogenase small subunit